MTVQESNYKALVWASKPRVVIAREYRKAGFVCITGRRGVIFDRNAG